MCYINYKVRLSRFLTRKTANVSQYIAKAIYQIRRIIPVCVRARDDYLFSLFNAIIRNAQWYYSNNCAIGLPVKHDRANFGFILSPRRTSVPISPEGVWKRAMTRTTRKVLEIREIGWKWEVSDGEDHRCSWQVSAKRVFPRDRFQLSREMKQRRRSRFPSSGKYWCTWYSIIRDYANTIYCTILYIYYSAIAIRTVISHHYVFLIQFNF